MYSSGICVFKRNNKDTRTVFKGVKTRCEICSKLTVKRPVNDVVLVSLLLTLNIFHNLFSHLWTCNCQLKYCNEKLLNNHSQNCQIRKRLTKCLKTQSVGTLMYLISIFLSPCACLALPASTVLGIVPMICTIFERSMWSLIDNPLILVCKEAFKVSLVNWFRNDVLVTLILAQKSVKWLKFEECSNSFASCLLCCVNSKQRLNVLRISL